MPSQQLPSVDALKTQAKALRRALEKQGHDVSHTTSLEMLAQQLGHRDWNTLHAATRNTPPPQFQMGQRISGHYLGHPVVGEIIGLRQIGLGALHHLTIRFDEAVDVIPFDGMKNLRKQVQAVVDSTGCTQAKTSDGRPHLQLEM